MIKHSEAKTIWRNLFNLQPSSTQDFSWEKVNEYQPFFPYRETMRIAKDVSVVPAMVQINLYFKHLSPENIGGYESVGTLWLKLIQYIPQSRYTELYRQLTQYFTQTKNYTPINMNGQSLI